MNSTAPNEAVDPKDLKVIGTKNLVSKFRETINKHKLPTVVVSLVVIVLSFVVIILYRSAFMPSPQTPSKSTEKTNDAHFVGGVQMQNGRGAHERQKTRSQPSGKLPTPVPLVQGPQTYSIGMTDTPQMYQVWFSTIDPKGGLQQVKLKVRDKLGKVNSVAADVSTDKLTKTYNMSLVSGTSQDGEWGTSWVLGDTYQSNFVITFTASDDKGHRSSVDLTIR